MLREISLVHRAKLLLYQAYKLIGVLGRDPLPGRSDANLLRRFGTINTSS